MLAMTSGSSESASIPATTTVTTRRGAQPCTSRVKSSFFLLHRYELSLGPHVTISFDTLSQHVTTKQSAQSVGQKPMGRESAKARNWGNRNPNQPQETQTSESASPQHYNRSLVFYTIDLGQDRPDRLWKPYSAVT
ncbi:Protein of unknown function [Pyronema omphalodes CBS 100304]|uniref:Uncharacterized protein n=1 Tax=Pyronema omphalodes (strain CBS 100304) TaxID=1076935 RepID=U4LD72_PYROM|nr:Protein of unknown function [Pyronema omphalodes CBS 100304]